MLYPNSGTLENIVFFTTSTLPWTDAIHTRLLDAGYQLSIADSVDSVYRILEQHRLDAVVAIESHESLTLFESVRSRTKDDRILLILIAEDMTSLINEQITGLADLILPPSPVYIEHQLQTFLNLQSERDTIYAQKHQLQEKHDELARLKDRLKQQHQQLEAEYKQLKRELDEQKRATSEVELIKNAIVRNVSHELKTPLLQVKSAVSLIAEDMRESTLIEYAKNATARLEMLVRNITMLGSSLETDCEGPVIVRDAIEYARRHLNRVWQHKDEADRIELVVEENLPPVKADKQGLSTVLQLLTDNALKFSEGTIEIIAERRDQHVWIAVRDTGIGIAKDKLDDIFLTFYQVDSSSTRRYGGTGVGLALVKLILDHHNVTIHVESDVNKGSTFSFSLPIVEI